MTMLLRSLAALVLMCGMLAPSLMAQEQEETQNIEDHMFVLDWSGSMWNTVDDTSATRFGVAKALIAGLAGEMARGVSRLFAGPGRIWTPAEPGAAGMR